MKLAALIVWSSLTVFSAKAGDDFYFWNYLRHPYQTYYLEDYCGPVERTRCDSDAHKVILNTTGSGSAVIIRGFRSSRPTINRNLKCCITMQTNDPSRFNVHLDDIYLKQKQIGERCENFLRFHGLAEELGHICSNVEKCSFRTPENSLEIDYVLNSENVPDFQKIKVVVTASIDTNTLQGGRCDATKEQWQCDNNNCIWEGFRCDAHNNCGDWSDELYCGAFGKYWTILLGVACGLFVAFLIWCVCRCCCCCCSSKSKQVHLNRPFFQVTTLAPNGRQQPQEKFYPTFENAYQNDASAPLTPQQQRGAPPPYNENAFLSPSYNASYGTNSKS